MTKPPSNLVGSLTAQLLHKKAIEDRQAQEIMSSEEEPLRKQSKFSFSLVRSIVWYTVFVKEQQIKSENRICVRKV